MFRPRAKSAVLLFTLLALGAAWADEMTGRDEPEHPLRTVRVVVDENSLGDLLAELYKFADANAFAMRVGHPRPAAMRVLVQMWREDIKILALNPFEVGRFRISLYENDTGPVSEETVDALVDALKGAIGSINGATISEDE